MVGFIAGESQVETYLYDGLGHLSTAIKGDTTQVYRYGANGNRIGIELTQGDQTTTKSATFDEQDRLTSFAQCRYQYDVNGALTHKACGSVEHNYDYDIFGNLLQVEIKQDGQVSKQIDYDVDPQNRRVAKYVDGQHVAGYLYSDQLNPVAQLNANGDVVALFGYASKGHVPDYMLKGGREYRYITDQLGSPRMLVDAVSGEIAQRLDYDVYGEVTYDSNPGFQPFGFAGGLYDSDTGLVRFGARDYDPYAARWTAKDPIGFAGGDTNLYNYVSADPVNFIDPTGHILANLYGAAKDGGMELLFQLYVEGKPFACVDYKAVVVAAVGGLAFGGAAAAKAYKMWKAKKKVRNTGAQSAKQAANLKDHLKQAEKYGKAGIKELQNGKIRYYGDTIPAKKAGEMAGRRTVREWDPATGAKRTWHETVDHNGTVRQVRPELNNGTKTHFMFDKNGNFTKKW